MEWYYTVNEEQQGPVNDHEFMELVTSGAITGTDLVWNVSMDEWAALGTLGIKARKPDVRDDMPAVPLETGLTRKACSECGQIFPVDELAAYHDYWVCQSCKPFFLQKLREGILQKTQNYAGFWIRAGAKIIDYIILFLVNFVLSLAAGALFIPAVPDPESVGRTVIPSIIIGFAQWGIGLAYGTWFVGRFGATPGKMACRLAVVTPDGEKVSYLRAFARCLAEYISGAILCIGYIMAGFDSEKRALHDRICSTRVVRTGD